MISCNKLTLSGISQSLKCNGIFGVKAFSGRDNKEKRHFFNINQCKKNIVSFNKKCYHVQQYQFLFLPTLELTRTS